MKVLHFVSKMDRAGQETFIMNIFRNIDRTRIQFNFLCSIPEKADYDDEIHALGGEIYYLPVNSSKGKFSKYFFQIRILKKWLIQNKDKYDVVHLHTYHAMDVWVHLEACRQVGAKIFVHCHSTNGMHHTLHKIMRRICHLYRYEKMACSTEAGIWLHGARDVKNGKVHVILNGIDTQQYRYDEETAKAYKSALHVEGRTVIGHVGRFHPAKNHSFMLDVFRAYLDKDPNAVLLLVGRGELEKDVRDQVKALGMETSVKFLGVRSDIPKLLNAFDVFVFPSIYEGLSISLVEAQCNGLAVLASDINTPEATISDNLKLLPLGDAQLWADEIASKNGKRTLNVNSEKFDIRKAAEQLSDMYLKYIK